MRGWTAPVVAATPPGSRKAAMKSKAKNAPISLDRIEEFCLKYELDWKWVEGQLEGMSNSGALIFPRPWSVQLVVSEEIDRGNEAVRDVTVDILALLSESDESIRVMDLIKRFEDIGISETSVESSLEKLMQKGEIFEPRSGHVQQV